MEHQLIEKRGEDNGEIVMLEKNSVIILRNGEGKGEGEVKIKAEVKIMEFARITNAQHPHDNKKINDTKIL